VTTRHRLFARRHTTPSGRGSETLAEPRPKGAVSRARLHANFCKFALVLVPALLAGAPADSPAVEQRIERVINGLLPLTVTRGQPIEKMRLADRLKHYNVPGVSVAVIHNYSLEWARGWGVKKAGAADAVTAETIFQAGSISKPVAALAALRLVQEGKLSLDEDVNGKLKSWKVPENEFTKEKKVTLRGIVSHSAGLTVHGFPGYAFDEAVPSLPQVLDGAKPANTRPIRVDTVPGTRERYSGGGYCVMQQMLIDVTGKPFPKLLEETVLRKLDMSHSTYENPLPAARAAAAATAHDQKGAPVPGGWNTYPEMAAAGLWTTPSDLGRFAIEIQKSKIGKSNKVLSAAMTNQMLIRQLDGFGLGLALDGKLRFGHGGVDRGFEAFLAASIDAGHGAVVMTNAQGGMRLARELILAIGAEYGWPDHRPREVDPPATPKAKTSSP